MTTTQDNKLVASLSSYQEPKYGWETEKNSSDLYL